MVLQCALSAVMLAKGEVNQTGVLPPEACLDPVLFLEELKKWGLQVGDSVKKIQFLRKFHLTDRCYLHNICLLSV